MDYQAFLNRIIDDGIAAASESYANDTPKREGAVAGFEACRGKDAAELSALLDQAHRATIAAYDGPIDDYWRARCYALEVEWVCNCMSAALMNDGLPMIVTPTCRGVMKAAEILGVREG